MNAMCRTAGVGSAVLILLFSLGCGMKGIQAGSGSKSLEEGVAKSEATDPETGETFAGGGPGQQRGPGAGGMEQGASPGMPGRPGVGGAPGETFKGQAPGQSFGRLEEGEPEFFEGDLSPRSPAPPGSLPGEERVTDEIMIAKADPFAPSSGFDFEKEMQQSRLQTSLSGIKDVFFEFDSWRIKDRGKLILSADAKWLKANLHKAVTIEGHCDERGTQAYNLVLGEKRAQAVRNYLVELGVQREQVSITSYGKTRPFCFDRNEDCYQLNRRAHMAVGSN